MRSTQRTTVARTEPRASAIAPVRELRDSLLLLGLAAVSVSGYVAMAFAAVRLLGPR